MKHIHVIFLLFLGSFFAQAQVGGTSVYQFLNISTSARQIALGGEVLTVLDDVNQPTWNPATIYSTLDQQLAVNYTSYLAGIQIGSIAYAHFVNPRVGTFQGNIQYVNYGTFIEADENGVETGTFKASDLALSVGYARPLPLPHFYIGMNAKLISANIQHYNSYGIATDLAILYKNPNKPYVFTLVARNIGTQLKTFNGTQEKIPFELAFGAAILMENVPLRWHGTFSSLQKWQIGVPNPSDEETDLDGTVTPNKVSFLDNAFRHITVGAELFPKSAVNLRVGYNFRRSKELALQNIRTFTGVSFGFGIQMRRMQFNYAYAKTHTATNTNTFSLLINLDK